MSTQQKQLVDRLPCTLSASTPLMDAKPGQYYELRPHEGWNFLTTANPQNQPQLQVVAWRSEGTVLRPQQTLHPPPTLMATVIWPYPTETLTEATQRNEVVSLILVSIVVSESRLFGPSIGLRSPALEKGLECGLDWARLQLPSYFLARQPCRRKK